MWPRHNPALAHFFALALTKLTLPFTIHTHACIPSSVRCLRAITVRLRKPVFTHTHTSALPARLIRLGARCVAFSVMYACVLCGRSVFFSAVVPDARVAVHFSPNRWLSLQRSPSECRTHLVATVACVRTSAA